eukprot:s4077_g2.t1
MIVRYTARFGGRRGGKACLILQNLRHVKKDESDGCQRLSGLASLACARMLAILILASALRFFKKYQGQNQPAEEFHSGRLHGHVLVLESSDRTV